MRIYIGMISKDTEGQPQDATANNYVKVRIPFLHGPKRSDENSDAGLNSANQYYTEESDLPWVHVAKPINFEGEFIASDNFEEDELVIVQALNDDLTNLIIVNKIGNFTATEDADLVAARINGTAGPGMTSSEGSDGSSYAGFSNSKSLINVALSQVGTKEKPTNNVKYNTEYYGREVSGDGYAWCAAFVWWCFKHAGLSQYYYNGSTSGVGKNCVHCETLKSYHEKKGESIKKNFKAGDVLFMNFNGGTKAQHVGIVIEDQSGDSVKTVEGNTSGSGSQSSGGEVMKKTRKMSQIVGGFRPGKATPNEQQCYEYFTQSMGFNCAAACGILGNIYYESSFRTTALGDKGTSYGICQWHLGRYDNLKKYCAENSLDYTSLIGQLQYLNHELTNSYKSVYNDIKAVANTKDGAYNAASIWCKRFEIPANADNEVKTKRGPKAKTYFEKYFTK